MKTVAQAVPAAARRVWARLSPEPPEQRALRLEVESKVADLSDGARIVLWHLKSRGLRPEVLQERLSEARTSANADLAIAELSGSGLIDHDFSGTRFIRPEVAELVRRLLP